MYTFIDTATQNEGMYITTISNAWMTSIDDSNMRPGFNFRSGMLDQSTVIDPKSQYVRARNQGSYRSSIYTDQGARSRRNYGPHANLPNEMNLHGPKPVLLWQAPADFDDTRFAVCERIQVLASDYRLSLQQKESAARDTINADGDERGASPARISTLLPVPVNRESRRLVREVRQRARPIVDGTETSEVETSESSSYGRPQRQTRNNKRKRTSSEDAADSSDISSASSSSDSSDSSSASSSSDSSDISSASSSSDSSESSSASSSSES